MALRKPLVLVSGQIQEIPPGDTVDAVVTDAGQFNLSNSSGGSLVAGTPVYVNGAGTFGKAKADASGTELVIGLVAAGSIANGSSGQIQSTDVLNLSTAQWDVVTGGSGGLTPNAKYYLSAATAGMLTTTAPSGSGQYVRPVGVAISSTILLIRIQPSVLLA